MASNWVPSVGDRVQISGIGGRPQLNGMFGTITGRAANGRQFVRLENIESEVVSLRAANLTGASSGGGGPSSSGGDGQGGGAGGPEGLAPRSGVDVDEVVDRSGAGIASGGIACRRAAERSSSPGVIGSGGCFSSGVGDSCGGRCMAGGLGGVIVRTML